MAFLEWLIHETSLHSLIAWGSRDIYLILLSRFLRMFAYGCAALVLGIFLWAEGKRGTQIGTFLTATLLGDAVISWVLTISADRMGRRRVLIIGSLLMILAGTVFASTKNYALLLIAAIVGVISPGAHEVGPFRAVQEAILAQLVPIEARTDIYAWFAVTSTVGMALGLCASGWISYILKTYFEYDWKECYPFIFGFYAIIGLLKVGVVLLMTDRCEPDYEPEPGELDRSAESAAPLLRSETGNIRVLPKRPIKGTAKVWRSWETVTTKLSPDSRRTLFRLCMLFAVNSFASAMLPVTLMSWYANYRYRWFVIYRVGYAMAFVWLFASIALLFSASVARRLGLIRAMVLLHLPNAIFLAFIPLAGNFWTFMILLFISSALGSLDQAPRSAFVAAVFPSSERTAVMGTLNFVRTFAAAGGPLVTGYFHDKKMWWATFLTAALLKISYDVGLLAMFLKTKLPENERGPREHTITDIDVGILLSEHLSRPEEFERLDDEDMEEEERIGHKPHGNMKYVEVADD